MTRDITGAISFDEIDCLTGGRLGTYDVPCPICGPSKRSAPKQNKRVLRIWRRDPHFATFKCARCGESGYARDGSATAVEMLAHDGSRPARAAPIVNPTSWHRGPPIWQRILTDTRPAPSTIVSTYLGSRGITEVAPAALRFHPRLEHRPSGTFWPGMIALVQRGTDGASIAIHRTYLSPAGSKAPVEPQKMMLGPCGGGAVRLAPATDFLMVGEGIETCLAAMQATGLPAWAALSTSGLKSLELPDEIHRVTILADGDDNGEAAAQSAGRRWLAEGREVRIARPPDGCDFNDLIAGGDR
jgi:hypothetical protein